MPTKCWSSWKYQPYRENSRMCSFLLVLLPLHPVLPSTHWVVTENGKIQAQVKIPDTNFTIYHHTSTLQTSSYHNHYLYQVLMVAVTNKIVMVIVIRNASTFTRELKWSTSLIIVTFWTAWQHIFPTSTTRLCSIYSSGGSHKSESPKSQRDCHTSKMNPKIFLKNPNIRDLWSLSLSGATRSGDK